MKNYRLKRAVCCLVMTLLTFFNCGCGKDDTSSNYFTTTTVTTGDTQQAPGALSGSFSVSGTRKVLFSMGNLQYSASGSHSVADNRTLPGTWRFAEHQYDYVGQANTMISSSYMGWIDLFGFGTSGWNSGAYAYQPYDASWEDYDYCSANLAGNYENADWGIYNAISNGGDLPGRWRTLTKDEWDYLLYRRTNATNKVGHATVNGMQGIVILPDDWRLPSSCTFTPDNYDYSYYYGEYRGFYYTNTYSVTQWDDMESRGAVFLPAAGQREGSDVRNVG
mgnify:FL=1